MTDEVEKKKSRQALKLGFAAVFMFGFAFALVPLYDVFCDVTGLNGKTGDKVEVAAGDEALIADKDRIITVQFLAVNNEGAPVKFGPLQSSVKVHPGEMKEVAYYATNLTSRELTTQSVPSVSPLEAAEHLKKMECFCFSQQVIAAKETKNMPLRFYVDKALPAGITKITLNYTIFDVSEPEAAEAMGEHHHHGDHDHAEEAQQ